MISSPPVSSCADAKDVSLSIDCASSPLAFEDRSSTSIVSESGLSAGCSLGALSALGKVCCRVSASYASCNGARATTLPIAEPISSCPGVVGGEWPKNSGVASSAGDSGGEGNWFVGVLEASTSGTGRSSANAPVRMVGFCISGDKNGRSVCPSTLGEVLAAKLDDDAGATAFISAIVGAGAGFRPDDDLR